MSASLPLLEGVSCGKNRSGIRAVDAVIAAARKLWASKVAANLAARSGKTMRSAEQWLEGSTDLSADALANLLRSDAGYAVLSELMAGANVRWWNEFERGVRLADLDRRIEWQRAQMESLKAEFQGSVL